MYERYSLNHGNYKLHRESCRFVKEVFHDERSIPPKELLAGVTRSVKCCKVCLKNDAVAQKAVEEHNNNLRWHPKK